VSFVEEPIAARVPLTRSDAWFLGAIADGSADGRWLTLSQFVEESDWLSRAIPTFDEVSYGLPRLIAAGYIEVDIDGGGMLLIRATADGLSVRRSVDAATLGGVLFGMAAAVGAAPYPEPQHEDRSRGRLDGLDPDALRRAVAEHSA
jgi:hypothetical protein